MMDLEAIKHQSQQLGVRERAKLSCLRCLHNEPLPRNWQASGLSVKLKSCSLVFENAYIDEPYFETCCLIFDGDEDVGTYTLMTSLDGHDLDDYLEFY